MSGVVAGGPWPQKKHLNALNGRRNEKNVAFLKKMMKLVPSSIGGQITATLAAGVFTGGMLYAVGAMASPVATLACKVSVKKGTKTGFFDVSSCPSGAKAGDPCTKTQMGITLTCPNGDEWETMSDQVYCRSAPKGVC